MAAVGVAVEARCVHKSYAVCPSLFFQLITYGSFAVNSYIASCGAHVSIRTQANERAERTHTHTHEYIPESQPRYRRQQRHEVENSH